MKRFRKYALISVGVLALALSGCGGSSGERVAPPPPPSAEEVAMEQLSTARANLTALSEYAPDEVRLPLEQAVLTAAQALLTARTAADASASSIATAQAQVDAAQAVVAATQQRIAVAKAAADRMAAQQQKIQEARDALAAAESALSALPGTATDAELLAAQRRVVTAATAVVDALVEADSMTSLVDAARAKITMAQGVVDATQRRIDDAAAAERERMRVAAEQQKIDAARAALTSARTALAALADYAPDTVRIALEKAVVTAAQGVVDALEAAEIDVPSADITAAMAAVTLAQGVVDATQGRIDAEAARQQALRDMQERIDAKRMALTRAKDAVAQLPDYTPDAVRLEAEQAMRTAAQALVDELMAADAPSSDVDAARREVTAADTAIAVTQQKIDDAMAAEEERQRIARETEREEGEIAEAREALMTAKTALGELAANALLAARTAARQAVLDAAKMVVMELEEAMYYKPSVAEITMARSDVESAQGAYDAVVAGGKFADEQLADARMALAASITDETKAEVLRALALEGNEDVTPTKQEMLYQAQAALAALPADATDAMKLAEQRKVLEAAKAWKMELEDSDAAHSMVMMAQAEVDAAQRAVDMTVAMMERGMQIHATVADANELAKAVRGASGAREVGGGGFDEAIATASAAVYDVNVSRLGPLSTVTFTLVDGTPDEATDDAAELTDFDDEYVVRYDNGRAVKMDVPAPQSISGWIGHQFWSFDEGTKATDVADDMETGRIVVYSDIEPGRNVAISAAVASGSTVSGITPDDNADGIITIGGNDVAQAGKSGAFGNFIPSEANTNRDYVYDSDTDKDGRQGYKGTFYGVAGEYLCGAADGDACRAVVDSKGNLSFTGTITFTATASTATARNALMLRNALMDDDYLLFGFWLKTTDGTTAADPSTYDLQTFAKGSDPYGTVSAVEGSATYAGNAAGIYVREESPGGQRGGNVVDATTGTFTASAELTATFGGDATTKTDDTFRISGTVTDFMNDAGRDLGWTVMLDQATTVSRTGATIDTTDTLLGTFEGTTTGDATAQRGSWNGEFFGPNDRTVLPSGVAGEFDANFNDGYVAGAFGATRD